MHKRARYTIKQLVARKESYYFSLIKFILLLNLLIVSAFSYAGKIERAYEALEIYNYFKAKKLFEKRLNNELVAASFGLSLIYGRNDNPFYNLDSARKYVYAAADQAPKMKERDRQQLKQLGVDTMRIQRWKDSVDHQQFEKVMKKKNLPGYQSYIDLHPDSKWKGKVIEARNALAFDLAKTVNSVSAYKNFIFHYPKARQVAEAKVLYERCLYEDITKDGNLASYASFVKKHTESPFYERAQDSVYAIATKEKNIGAYHNFIKRFPSNPNVTKSWRNIYKLYMEEYSPQRIVEFQIDFPKYPFLNELKLDLNLAQQIYLPFKKDGKWGFIDTSGKVMLAPMFNSVEPFKNGLSLVVKKGMVGYIDKTGEAIIPFEYADGESFDQGIAVVEKDGFYGLINRANQNITPFKYDLIGGFNSDLALIANDTAYGYLNKKGEEVIPLIYSYASDFKNGFALIEKKGKKGIINTSGEFVIPAEYDWLEVFDENGICRVKQDSLFGLLNRNAALVLPMEYEAISTFSEGYALVAKNGQYAYVNSEGKIKIPFKFDYKSDALIWGQFENGYAKYFLKGKYGIIDTSGKRVVPAIFENIGSYNDSTWFAVKKRGKWGFSNQQLKLSLPYQYDYASTFIDAYAKVQMNGSWGLINKEGEFVIPNEYDKIQRIKSWGFLLKRQNKIKMLQTDLNPVTEQLYTTVMIYNEQFMQLQLEDDSYHYLEKATNKIIIPQR